MHGEEEPRPEHELELVRPACAVPAEREQDDVDESTVVLDLRAVVALDDVLDDQRVEPEVPRRRQDVRVGRFREVDPDRAGSGEQAGQIIERRRFMEGVTRESADVDPARRGHRRSLRPSGESSNQPAISGFATSRSIRANDSA